MRPVVIPFVVLAIAFRVPAAWGAVNDSRRSNVVAFEFGLIDPPRHLIDVGPNASRANLPEYAGVVFDGRVLPHLHLDGQLGVNFIVGWMTSLSARLAADVSMLTISVGAGPMIALDPVERGPAAFANVDVSAIMHFDGPFVLLFRAGGAWALSGNGTHRCGIDTCEPYLARGDRIISARLGIGSSF